MNAPAPVREAGPWPFDPEVRRVARELRDDMGGREAAAGYARVLADSMTRDAGVYRQAAELLESGGVL